LRDLRLVNPREYERYRVEGIAHQTQDVLRACRPSRRWRTRSPNAVHIVGFTARGRTAKRKLSGRATRLPRSWGWARAVPVALLSAGKTRDYRTRRSIVCHRIVTIPSDPGYASLTLATPSIIMRTNWRLRGREATPFKEPRRPLGAAVAADLERIFADVAKALHAIEFFKTRNADGVMRTMREIAHRTPLDTAR